MAPFNNSERTMKIIGHLGHIVTVTMSEHELQNIIGRTVNSGTIEFHGRWHPFELCGEINVRDGWDRLRLLKANREELNKAQRQLRAIADVLEPLELVVSPDIEPQTAEAG